MLPVVNFLPHRISENLIFSLWFLHLLGFFSTYTQQTERESVEEAHLLLKCLGQEVTDVTSDHMLLVRTSLTERESSSVPRKQGSRGLVNSWRLLPQII